MIWISLKLEAVIIIAVSKPRFIFPQKRVIRQICSNSGDSRLIQLFGLTRTSRRSDLQLNANLTHGRRRHALCCPQFIENTVAVQICVCVCSDLKKIKYVEGTKRKQNTKEIKTTSAWQWRHVTEGCVEGVMEAWTSCPPLSARRKIQKSRQTKLWWHRSHAGVMFTRTDTHFYTEGGTNLVFSNPDVDHMTTANPNPDANRHLKDRYRLIFLNLVFISI